MSNKFYFEHQPMTIDEKDLIYYHRETPDALIGHLRGYLDNSGCLQTTWFDCHLDQKTYWFHEEFNALVKWLRGSILKDRRALVSFLSGEGNATPLADDDYFPPFGIKVITDRFSYYIKLKAERGDYNLYIYCYTNTVKRYGDYIEVVKVTPRHPWQGAYRVYSCGIHEATLDTLEQADELALDLLDIQNDTTIMEEEEA